MPPKFILITNYVNGEIVDRQEFQLGKGNRQITIGRQHTCDFVVSRWGELGRHVSKIHCTIYKKDGSIYLKDGGDKASVVGTYWGRRRLDQGEELLLECDRGEDILALPTINPVCRITVMVSLESANLQSKLAESDETIKVAENFRDLSIKVARLEQCIQEMKFTIAQLKADVKHPPSR